MAANALRDCFISGLRPELRPDVVSMRPISMSDAVGLAKLYEEKYTTSPKPNLWVPKPYYALYQSNTKYTNSLTSPTT